VENSQQNDRLCVPIFSFYCHLFPSMNQSEAFAQDLEFFNHTMPRRLC